MAATPQQNNAEEPVEKPKPRGKKGNGELGLSEHLYSAKVWLSCNHVSLLIICIHLVIILKSTTVDFLFTIKSSFGGFMP